MPADLARLKSLSEGAGTIADLPGFMDEAFTMTSNLGATLVARKDSRMVDILSAAPLDREKALVTKLFGVL